MTTVTSPLAGRAIGLASVPDPVFSGAMVGPGTAIDPVREPSVAVSPVDGVIVSLHPHAFVVATADGAAVLVHLGIDTVKRKGEGFTVHVVKGEVVQAGQPIVTWDPAEVEARYHAEVEALVKQVTGAPRVVVFDTTVRSGRVERQQGGIKEPARRIHNDYTEKSGPQRVRDLLPDEAPSLLKRRFAVINVWRPIAGPLLDAPPWLRRMSPIPVPWSEPMPKMTKPRPKARARNTNIHFAWRRSRVKKRVSSSAARSRAWARAAACGRALRTLRRSARATRILLSRTSFGRRPA